MKNQIPEDLFGDAVEGLHHLKRLRLRKLVYRHQTAPELQSVNTRFRNADE